MTPPRWPFVLGAVAGVIFGSGAFLYLAAIAKPSHAVASAGVAGLITGSALLAIAWFGATLAGRGGPGALLGSVAVPLALAYAYSTQLKPASLEVTGTMLVCAFAAQALGYAATRGLGVTRVVALGAGLLWSLALLSIVQHSRLGLPFLMFALVASGLVGFTLPFGFYSLRAAPREFV
jgi:hypothetical protein